MRVSTDSVGCVLRVLSKNIVRREWHDDEVSAAAETANSKLYCGMIRTVGTIGPSTSTSIWASQHVQ